MHFGDFEFGENGVLGILRFEILGLGILGVGDFGCGDFGVWGF